MPKSIEKVSIVTSDTAVRTGLTTVHWVAVSAGASGGAFQLNDSTDDSGTDKLNLLMAATTTLFLNFDPSPIEFKTGLYIDVPGTNVTVNVGWT
jgi:hypothetical protein